MPHRPGTTGSAYRSGWASANRTAWEPPSGSAGSSAVGVVGAAATGRSGPLTYPASIKAATIVAASPAADRRRATRRLTSP